MTWEREPGSVGLARTAEDVEQRRQFVDSWSASGVLGHVEERCDGCSELWTPGAAQCGYCGSNVFTQRPVEAQPVVLGPAGKLKRWLKPEKPAAPAPDPADVAALAALAEATRAFAAALVTAEAASRRIVVSGAEGFAIAQGVLATIATPGGDSSVKQLDHSLLPLLEALTGLLEEPTR